MKRTIHLSKLRKKLCLEPDLPNYTERIAGCVSWYINAVTVTAATVFFGFTDVSSCGQQVRGKNPLSPLQNILLTVRKKIGGKKHITIEVYFTDVGKIRILLAKPELPTEIEKPA